MDFVILIQALNNTPLWVYLVLLGLLVLGYQQSKDRQVGHVRLLILPLILLMFSFYGVLSSFGFTFLPVLAWSLGFLPLMVFARTLLKPKIVSFSPTTATFHIRGSWLPMVLLLGIFSVKYAIGYSTARHLPILQELWFIICVCLVLGLLGGVLTTRAIAIWVISLKHIRVTK